jgi:hypothetical protein
MVPIVVPFGGEEARLVVGIEPQEPGGVLVVFDGEMDVPVGKLGAHLARHLRQDLFLRRVLDLIDGIEAKSVEAELLEPVKHVVNEELADRRAVEGDGAAPGRLPLGMEEVRRVEMKIVSVRPEVIIDHVEQDHQLAFVAGVDQPLQPFRPAIDAVRRVEQHPVIAPAAIAPELRHRQELDGRDADIHQAIEIADDAVEGPVEREGAGVQLVEDCLFPGAPLPLGRAPVIASWVHEPARPVHVADLCARGGIGHAHPVRQDILVAPIDGNRVGRHLEPAVLHLRHGNGAAAFGVERDHVLGRRPKPEARAAVDNFGAPGQCMRESRSHQSVLSNSRSPRPGMVVLPVAIGASGRIRPLAESQRSRQRK